MLDGWWAEGYDGAQRLGAVRATSTTTTRRRTPATRHELYRLLEEEVVPEFYERGDDGLPQTGWRASAARCARSGRSSAPARMLEDYERKVYR